MPYDKSLDVETFKEEREMGDTKLTVGVFSYNQGGKKIQISRENRNRDGEWQFVKMGRLNKEEAEAILPLMQKALEQM
ncbi:MAG: hypothetical protein ABIJ41_01275 [Candidatus Omnitrophota bacterium]